MKEVIKNNFLSSIILLFSLCIGLYFFSLKITGLNFTFFPGDLGDGRLNLYFLEHNFQFFLGKAYSYWDVPFMYPEKNVLAYSDNLIGSAPIYCIYRFIGFNIYKSYQLWYITVTILNFLCAYYFIKYVFKNNYAAIIGAFIFAFSLALQSQLTHAQTFPRYTIPLVFLAAYKFNETYNLKYFLYALLLLVYQFYCGIYLGLMLAIPTSIYLFWILFKGVKIEHTIKINFKWFFKLSLIFLLNFGLLALLMYHYLLRKNSPNSNHYLSVLETIPNIKSYFTSQQGSLMWDNFKNNSIGNSAYWDHQLFTGGIGTICFFIFCIVVLTNLYKNKFKLHKTSYIIQLGVIGLITFLIFLKFNQYSLYYFIYKIPGYSAMRSITRIINIELLFFSISISYLYVFIINKIKKMQFIIFSLLFLIIVFDNYFNSTYSYKTVVELAKNRTETLKKSFKKLTKHSVISYEPLNNKDSLNPIYIHLDAMLLAQEFELNCINAYTGNSPSAYKNYLNKPSIEGRKKWINQNYISTDTLYVINSPFKTEKINLKLYYKLNPILTKIQIIKLLIDEFKSNTATMKEIEIKARKKNVSIETMLVMDALWVYNHENKL
ncbi:MAG: hypothetical protein U0V03_02645 [Bacteroidia bacterium]